MIQTSECQLEKISAHLVGNKHNGEKLMVSEKPLDVADEELNEILQHYFLSHFSSPAFFSFQKEDEEGYENTLYI